MSSETSPENQKFEPAYFLKLITALAILATVWFGSSFFGNKPADETKEAANNRPTQTAVSASQEFAFVQLLPASQDAFLIPSAEIFRPIRKWGVNEPTLSAQSIYAFDDDSGKVLLQKEQEKIRPIASLSKLMTALIVLERANLDEQISVSKNAIETEGEMGNLVVNEKFSIKSLLYAMLIASSNDAAVALAEQFDGQFINFMNQKAKELGLKSTKFLDPSGLNPENSSNAIDLAQIMKEALKYPIISQITKTPEIDINSADGKYNHHLTNSDKLLGKYPEIIAGKTGYIDEAGNCMLVAIQSPNNSTIINVILASQDRLGDMDKLIQWEKEAFVW